MGEVRGESAAKSASIPTKYATYVINNSEDKKEKWYFFRENNDYGGLF